MDFKIIVLFLVIISIYGSQAIDPVLDSCKQVTTHNECYLNYACVWCIYAYPEIGRCMNYDICDKNVNISLINLCPVGYNISRRPKKCKHYGLGSLLLSCVYLIAFFITFICSGAIIFLIYDWLKNYCRRKSQKDYQQI